jgi:hypothetical protein
MVTSEERNARVLTSEDRTRLAFVIDLVTRDELRAKLVDICGIADTLCYRSARLKISQEDAGQGIAELMLQLQEGWEDMQGDEHDRMDDHATSDPYWFADPEMPTDEFEGFGIAQAAREALACATTAYPGGWVDTYHDDVAEGDDSPSACTHESGAGDC